MEKEKAIAVLGLSINPEITWSGEGEKQGERIFATPDYHTSGTSFDVALAMRACGIRPMLIGTVGEGDLINAALVEDLTRRGIDNLLLGVREKTPWACIEPEAGRRLSFKKPVIKAGDREIKDAVAGADFQYKLVSGLMPDPLEMDMAKAILAGDGIKVLMPSFPVAKNQECFRELAAMSNWVFMNRNEAGVNFGCDPKDITVDMVKSVLSLGPTIVVVTLDKEGSIMVSNDGTVIQQPAHEVVSIDETGAGDCFVGFFIGCMHKGFSKEDALQFATIAGGLKASRMGTINIPTWDEVMEIYQKM